MGVLVKKLPARGKTAAKFQILTLVSQLEHKYSEPTGQSAQVLFQMPSQHGHKVINT